METINIEYYDDYRGLKNLYKIKIIGNLPPGSDGNPQVMEWNKIIQDKVLVKNAKVNVIFDFIELNYVFGDAIGTLWILLLKYKMRIMIIANNETKKNLLSLISHSIPVPVVETEIEALYLLRNNIQEINK